MADLAAVKALPILDVARELGMEVRRDGFTRCLRPEAHSNGDKNPSLHLDPRTNRFRCFVCSDVAGSPVDLVMNSRRCTLPEAAHSKKHCHFDYFDPFGLLLKKPWFFWGARLRYRHVAPGSNRELAFGEDFL